MDLAALNVEEIIKRGYVFEEEYDLMHESNKMEKLRLSNDDGSQGEHIWIYPLESSDTVGTKFHFVFFNDPLHFIGGPRPTAGMVGIGTAHGPKIRGAATVSENNAMFKKAGVVAIEYFHTCMKKHRAQGADHAG